ncbi:MAG: lipid II flippase MurJ [Polyangiaceae bacterium]|jgi:putative peptidoglycan lipid II flippase
MPRTGDWSIARTAALLLPVQLTFRAGEAAMPILLAAWFGRSEATDVFFLFSVYFTFAGSLVSGGFQDSVLVPIVAGVRQSDPAGMQAVASSLLGHVLAVGTVLAAILGAIAVAWASLKVPVALFATAAALSAYFGLHLVAVGVRSLLVALLNAHGRYFAHPVASGSGFGLAILVIAVGRHTFGVASVPLGLLAGETLAIAMLAPFARLAIGLRLWPSLARPEPVGRFLRLVLSDVAGATITRINPVIDQLVAGTVGAVGGGTILRYATEVGAIPTTLLQATVLPVLLSRLSMEAAGESRRTFAKTVFGAITTAAALLALLAGVLVLVRRGVLRAVFLHGQMDADAVDSMAAILPWAAVGSIPFGVLLVLARAHVALQNTRIMLPLGVLNASLNIVFDLVLVRVAGLRGIAFATSLVHLVIAVVFWHAMRRRLASG